jgi:biotin carboxyl carrier protein
MKYYVEVDGQTLEMDIAEDGSDFKVSIDGIQRMANLQLVSPPSLYSLLIDNKSYNVFVEQREDDYVVMLGSTMRQVRVQDERTRRLAAVAPKTRRQEGELVIKAPMPGLVVAICVNPDDVVEKGTALVVLETMKMQNEIRAPQAGTVKLVSVEPGQTVEGGQMLLVLA